MRKNSFKWSTTFNAMIVVDGELFTNTYDVDIGMLPLTPDLQEQSMFFDRLKIFFELVLSNSIFAWRDEPLYEILKDETNNRFVELPKQPFDQVTTAVIFSKLNAILEGKILIESLELSSYQGDNIRYSVDTDSDEHSLLLVDNWFSSEYNNFDPWWLRADTATYDEELDNGIYTGHFKWFEQHEFNESCSGSKSAKVFEFSPTVIEGGKDKD